MLGPLDPFDPMARLQMARFQAQQGQPEPPKIPPLSLEEENALLPKIAGATLGGLGFIGGSLEKAFGGRALRGILADRPRELLSIIPLSDTLRITDEADRVGGRELLRHWGLAGDEDTWGNFGAGLAVDILGDPGTYLTFGSGAASQAGKVAQKIGVMPKSATGRVTGTLRQILTENPSLREAAEIAAEATLPARSKTVKILESVGDLPAGVSATRQVGETAAPLSRAELLESILDQPLGGLFGWHIPFTNVGGTFLEGQAGLNVLNKISDFGQAAYGMHKAASTAPGALGWGYTLGTMGIPLALEKGIQYGGRAMDWMGRHARALLDSSVMGATSRVGQETAEEAFANILPSAARFREKAYEYAQKLKELGALDTDEFRLALENIRPHPNAEVNAIADAMRADYKAALDEAQALGLDIKQFADKYLDIYEYGHRQWSPSSKVDRAHRNILDSLRPTDATLQTGRQSNLQGFKRGTVGINEMIDDPYVWTEGPVRSAAHIRANYLVDPAEAAAATGRPVEEIIKEQRKQALSLARWIRTLPDEYRRSALGELPERLAFFGHHPIQDYLTYFDRFARMKASAEAAQNLLAKHAFPGVRGQPGAMTLNEALTSAGLVSPPPLVNPGPGETVLGGAQQAMLNRINAIRAKNGLGPLSDLTGQYVPVEIAKELGGYMNSFRTPEALHPFVDAFDWLTNLFKAQVTVPWPGFHVRNLLSGQFTNAARGAADAPLATQAVRRHLATGEAIPLANELPQFAGMNLTPEEATEQVARWYAAHNVGGRTPNVGREIISDGAAELTMPMSLDDILSHIPGQSPKSFGTAWEKLKGGFGDAETSLHPLRFADVAGVNSVRDVFAPVAAGHEAGDVIEYMNRMPMFMSYLKQGYTPTEAARQTIKAHFDYSKNALTPFEKTWMRRLVPFYSFTRQNIPSQIEQIMTAPGSLAGLTARAAFEARNQPGEFIPEHLGESLAIPLGEETPEGYKRFLTRLDLPPEQAFEFFKGTMGDPVQDSLMGLMGQLNPLLKGPLEYAVNKQLFSGRELGDLYSMTGNYLLDQILYSSPFARLATTFRTVTDPRKFDPYAIPLNVLTGAKVTDVDMPKYRSIAEREYVKERLQGLPAVGKFETIAVKPELLHTLTPDELRLVKLQKLIEQRAREKQRKIRIEGR